MSVRPTGSIQLSRFQADESYLVHACSGPEISRRRHIEEVARDQIVLETRKPGNGFRVTASIRKKSDTYVGYIDLYRSIGWLGNPLLYRSS